MTFKFNQSTVSRRRYGSSTSFSVSSSSGPLLPTVSGGALYSDETYYYRAFTSSGDLTIADGALSFDYLVIGGGGSGAGYPTNYNGGGAAGDVLGGALSLSPGLHPVVVGAGGAGSYSVNHPGYYADPGNPGNYSQLSTVVAAGGGGGIDFGTNFYISTTYTYTSTPSGGSNSAYTGGRGYHTLNYGSGRDTGGGGAGAGENGGEGTVPRGGNGTTAFSSWGLVTGLGENVSGTVYFGGGGGGMPPWNGGYATSPAGLGGGAVGFAEWLNYHTTYGPHATANTGGGAGSTRNYREAIGGNGGSGVVIIRYLKSSVAA